MGFVAKMFGFNKKTEPAPAPAPLPQAPTPEVAAEKATDTIKKKKAMLSASSKSIYTSPLGSAGEADVARKTLLGQ
jgi:hypothetical protein